MIQVFMCLLVLGPSLYSVTEGCGRVPATPAPSTTPTPTEPTINGSLRGVQCTGAEVNKTACLNGGTCFVLKIDDVREASCHCTREYEGARCQQLNIDVIVPSQDPDQIARAGIAASIAVLVIILIVFIAVAIVYYRRRREEEKQKKRNGHQANGSLLPENHIQPPNPNMQYAKNGHHCNNIEEKKPLQSYQITSV